MADSVAVRPPEADGSAVPLILRRRWRDRARAALRRAAPALACYAAVRMLGVICLAAWAWHVGRSPRVLLSLSWDGIWYYRVAEYGYGTVIPSPSMHGVFYNDLAFFPVYPALIQAVDTLTPLGPANSALLVSWTAAALTAWGLYMIGELLHGRRVGVVLATLWGVLPHAIIETMAYTESVMTAFAAWSLYAVLKQRWLWAGTLAAAAGLTRPNGIAVAAAVCAGAAVTAFQRRRARSPIPWRLCAGAALAPAGWVGYVLWVGWLTGRPDGYFTVQSKWGSTYDFGWYAVHYARDLVVGRAHLVHYMVLAVAGVALVLLVLSALDRQPPALVVYSLVLVAISLGGTNFFQCKPRFLLPAFALLLPVAVAMARARTRTAVVTCGALALLSAFYGTYLLTVSRFAL
jgi:hypothetical protein